MPADILAFSAPGSESWDVPALVGPVDDQRPFPEDPLHIISREPTSLDRPFYVAPPLSTPHPTRAGFYFTGDADHRTDDIGDVLTFAREWANIPRSFVRRIGTTSYRFPGIVGSAAGSPLTLTAMSPASTSFNYLTSPVFTSAAHGLSVGDKVHLSISLTWSGGSGTSLQTAIVTAVTTDTFTVGGIFLTLRAAAVTFSSGTATKLNTYRVAKTMPADSIEAYSFALPGVTAGIATAADFRPDPVFAPVVASTGEETELLAGGTVPTDTEYRAQMAAGGYFAIESGVSKYRGEILQRRTLLVRYL